MSHFYFFWESFANEDEDEILRWQMNGLWKLWCEWGFSHYRYWSDYDHPIQSLDELLTIDNYWVIRQEEFFTLYDFWTSNSLKPRLDELMNAYENAVDELNEYDAESKYICLKFASVVGMTTTCVAKNQKLLAALRPKAVIVEEAAEVLEAHVLTSLSSSTQQLIMIGDHKQLRPKIDQWILQAESNSGFDLDVSLFERLVAQNKIPHVTLHSQRRMRPQFSRYQTWMCFKNGF